MPYFEVKDNDITIDKKITKLDEFVLDIFEIIEKYTDYVIISGYVSIFFGRSRATEDVDAFVEEIPYDKFERLYKELKQKDYEFTIDNPKGLYEDYLMDGTSIRIWKKDFPLLNLEVKFALKPIQKLTFKDRIVAKFGDKRFYFGQIEAQIAYKRYILKSQKDLEDARHLEIVFKNLSKEKLEYYKKIFEDDFKR